MTARIGGAAADLESAVQAAASLLGRARQPVVGGLAADVAGVTAAIELARRLRGVADHAHSAAMLRSLELMRRSGWIITTPVEARARADLVLLAGPGLEARRPEVDLILAAAGPSYFPGVSRQVLRVGDAEAGLDLADQLGLVRIVLRERDVQLSPGLRACAEALRAARYPVVVWSAAEADAAAIEAICGLVEDLNARGRAAGLPLLPSDNAAGAAQVAAWLTGYPLPVGFGRGQPEHDPWRFGAARIVESGEGDAAMWIAALGAIEPPWQRALPLVALVPADAASAAWLDGAGVTIAVGRPGTDHDAVLHDPRVGGLAVCKAQAPGPAPSVGAVIAAITAALASC